MPCTGEISEKEDNSDPLVLMCMQTCRTMANRDTIPKHVVTALLLQECSTQACPVDCRQSEWTESWLQSCGAPPCRDRTRTLKDWTECSPWCSGTSKRPGLQHAVSGKAATVRAACDVSRLIYVCAGRAPPLGSPPTGVWPVAASPRCRICSGTPWLLLDRYGWASHDNWCVCAGAELHKCLCGLWLTCNVDRGDTHRSSLPVCFSFQ